MRVSIITNIVPEYRIDFYRRINRAMPGAISIFCHERVAGSELRTAIAEGMPPVVPVRYVGLMNERFGWQRLPVRTLLRTADVLVFYGNPRLASNVVWSLFFRLVGKKVIVWGQVHTAYAKRWTEALRLLWWRCFESIFVYTDYEAERLRNRGFSKQTIVGMNNGLDQAAQEREAGRWTAARLVEWQEEKLGRPRQVILTCARLVAKNRFDLVAKAVAQVRAAVPDLLWCVIGDGPERGRLEQLVVENKAQDSVMWLGAVFEEAALAPWFLSATVMVHPSGIGLSLMKAFGYGVPVITHGNEKNQMPEYAALVDGKNGLTFAEGSVEDLSEKLLFLLKDEALRRRLSEHARETVRRHYNTAVMAQRFVTLLDKVR